MAGKGRGVAAFTFNIEALGITRGSMPETQRGPRALFPQTEFKPVPLKTGEDVDYMLALKQEIRGRMKGLPASYIKSRSGKRDIERYKHKYARECHQIEDKEWTPDWNYLPVELKPQKKTIQRRSGPKKSKKVSNKDNKALLFKLDELEKRGEEKSDEEKEEKVQKGEEEEEEEAVDGEEYDEEELEEDNDYIENYFEDGDDFAAGSDDNMDEATY